MKKTHKVIIVEECMRSGGIGASVSSWCARPDHPPLPPPYGLLRALAGAWRAPT